jgi:two-component system response regulator
MNGVILMVEDNPDDARLVERQLQNSGLSYALRVVSDGREAMDYLSGAGEYADRAAFPLPCLLLIDLRMPRVDGFVLTGWVRANPATKDIPIIIYTGLPSQEEAVRAYALGANAYVVKLPGVHSFDLLFDAIREFCDGP